MNLTEQNPYGNGLLYAAFNQDQGTYVRMCVVYIYDILYPCPYNIPGLLRCRMLCLCDGHRIPGLQL